jgi:hypothetical protein
LLRVRQKPGKIEDSGFDRLQQRCGISIAIQEFPVVTAQNLER